MGKKVRVDGLELSSINRVSGLECDGCGVCISPDPFIYRKSVTNAEDGLRMTARIDMGWVYVNGEDRCPECRTPGVAR